MYLLTVRNIEQRFRVDKARKCLNSVEKLDLPDTNHSCPLCSINIELDLDNIIEAESELCFSVRQGLLYIASYVTRKLPHLGNMLEEDDTV